MRAGGRVLLEMLIYVSSESDPGGNSVPHMYQLLTTLFYNAAHTFAEHTGLWKGER
jgi:hypothetical protein